MSRAATASSILKRYALTSGGAGRITAPFLGMAALTALHLALGEAFVPGWLGFGDVKHLHQAVRHLFSATAPSTP